MMDLDWDELRKMFEQWASKNIGRISRSTSPGYTDEYEDSHTNLCWKAYQQGILDSPRLPGTVADL